MSRLKNAQRFRLFSAWAVASLLGAATLVAPKLAHAQLPSPEPLPVAKVKGWEISLDGRLNTFVSFSRGKPQPSGYPLWQGFDDKPDADGNITTTRLRS